MAQLSEQAIQEITQYLEVQGLDWAKQFIAARRAWLTSKGTKASGALIDSLHAEVLTSLEGAAVTRIELAFAQHGRFIDIKNLRPAGGGSDYIAALEDWIEKKGLADRFRSGFVRKRGLKKAPLAILNQMAWGIAIKRHSNYRRRKTWYNKPKSGSITELYNRVAANLPDLVARELKAAFNQ